jgi:uncharacterized phiE125 gp8 family phage protein
MAYRPRERFVTYAAPTVAVVGLAEMKRHLRVDHNDEDQDIAAYEAAAVATVERQTQRLLTPRTATLRLPGLPTGRTPIELPGGAVSAVASVTVNDVALTGFAAFGHSPAVLVPDADWPVLVSTGGFPVVITYTAGFAVVPGDLVSAVKLICGSIYDQRANSAPGSMSDVPISAEYLMRAHRIPPL